MLVQVYFSSLLLTRYGDQKLWSDMQKETVYSDLQVSRASFMSHFVINHQSTNQSPSHSPHFTHGSSCTSFLPSLTPSLFHSAHNLLFSQVFPPQTADTLPLDCLLGLRLLFGLMLIGLFHFHIIIYF